MEHEIHGKAESKHCIYYGIWIFSLWHTGSREHKDRLCIVIQTNECQFVAQGHTLYRDRDKNESVRGTKTDSVSWYKPTN